MAAWLMAALLLPHVPALAESGFSDSVPAAQVAALVKRFGMAAAGRIADWQQTMQTLKNAPSRAGGSREQELLAAVNDYFNRNMAFVDDLTHWGVEDYWASPAEFVGSGGGDCEDYVIAKYYALKELGTAATRLRITYVRSTRSKQPHMILAYYASPDAEPLVLDNLEQRVLPAAQRPDLTPVYSFNEDELWLARGGGPTYAGNPTQVRLWRTLQDKLRREQAQ